MNSICQVTLNLRAGVYVSAAIFHTGSLLLIRRVSEPAGVWELPGGSVEQGEGLEQALHREVQEETGLPVTIGRPFFVSTFETDGQEGTRVTIVAIRYLCTTPSREPIRLSPTEHDGVAWVHPEGLPNYRLAPDVDQVIVTAFRLNRSRDS
jgi:8-oxo-dGTP diphosphatase